MPPPWPFTTAAEMYWPDVTGIRAIWPMTNEVSVKASPGFWSIAISFVVRSDSWIVALSGMFWAATTIFTVVGGALGVLGLGLPLLSMTAIRMNATTARKI